MNKYLIEIFYIKSDVQQLLIMASQAKQQIKVLKVFEASPDELQRQQAEHVQQLCIGLVIIFEMIELFEQILMKLKIMKDLLSQDHAEAATNLATTEKERKRET